MLSHVLFEAVIKKDRVPEKYEAFRQRMRVAINGMNHLISKRPANSRLIDELNASLEQGALAFKQLSFSDLQALGLSPRQKNKPFFQRGNKEELLP